MKLLLGDCLEKMKELEENSVDAIVTDPPYGLSFMGKDWDHGIPGKHFWEEAIRVAKPGAYLLAFGGTRTYHRLACAIEDAGWEIRDCISWVYGQGFPKSLDISKALDKMAGAEREVVEIKQHAKKDFKENLYAQDPANANNIKIFGYGEEEITVPSTDAAKQWDGWGTALKPAYEPIVLARKPLSESTVAGNVLKYGTGGINIDGCRIETAEQITNHSRKSESALSKGKYGDSTAQETFQTEGQQIGRFPSNFIHDGSEEVLEIFPETKSGNLLPSHKLKASENNCMSGSNQERSPNQVFGGDSGSAARFFYCAKASKSDRDEGLENFLDSYERKTPMAGRGQGGLKCTICGKWKVSGNPCQCINPEFEKQDFKKESNKNIHPTVKPTSLMQYLCRLITPPNGIILDPFMGSGSTGKAAILEGFDFIGIEKEEEYLKIAETRISFAQKQKEEESKDIFTSI
jgi:DNA modification methylase